MGFPLWTRLSGVGVIFFDCLEPGNAIPLDADDLLLLNRNLGTLPVEPLSASPTESRASQSSLHFLADFDSYMTGPIRFFSYRNSHFVIESDTQRKSYLRRLFHASDVEAFVQSRRDHYESLWDG
jgi:hypothetical protein